jgi:hypothetical protein
LLPQWIVAPHERLTEVFRQKEQDFVDMLNRFRLGKVLPEDTKRMQQCVGSKQSHGRHGDGIEPTQLFAVKHGAEKVNMDQMKKLRKPVAAFCRVSSFRSLEV